MNRNLEYMKIFRVEFETYAETHDDANPTNTAADRPKEAIFLGEYIWWILMSGGKEFSHGVGWSCIIMSLCICLKLYPEIFHLFEVAIHNYFPRGVYLVDSDVRR